mmetsp:Transcript_29071/g.93385  ORF Transcript_29071/g.93385 Transcript_29071/m.93385 type:complete len:255 (-) Transcript_29071:11-775(-)
MTLSSSSTAGRRGKGALGEGGPSHGDGRRGTTDGEATSLLRLCGELVLLPDAVEAVVGAEQAQLVEDVVRLHLVGDHHRLLALRQLGHLEDALDLGLDGGGDLLLARVARLDLVALLREDNQRRLVLLEPLRVELQRLGRAVPPAVVDGNADGPRLLLVDPRLLQLREGEAAALPQLVVVLVGRRVHRWTQQADGPRRDSSRLGSALQAPALLARGLVEPRLDVVLPQRLVEVLVGHHIVVPHHFLSSPCAWAR